MALTDLGPIEPGIIAKRPLHFIWIADCSGSMFPDKIQSLNDAIREAIPEIASVAEENPRAEILMRAIAFSNSAYWHIATPTKIEEFKWIDLQAHNLTAMGAAMRLTAEALAVENMPERGLPPVLVLISDGQPNDDFDGGLAVLDSEPWGKKAVRCAIAIGQDADELILQQFIKNIEIPVLQANNPGDLKNFIKWVSTTVVGTVSKGSSKPQADGSDKYTIPTPVPHSDIDTPDVW